MYDIKQLYDNQEVRACVNMQTLSAMEHLRAAWDTFDKLKRLIEACRNRAPLLYERDLAAAFVTALTEIDHRMWMMQDYVVDGVLSTWENDRLKWNAVMAELSASLNKH
jgi:hypothetical protein